MLTRLTQSHFFERTRARLFLFVMGFVRRTTLGARAMLIDGQKVLLIKHTYSPGWMFPGGGVEVGQSALAAAKREVFEETGYVVEGEGKLISIYHNKEASPRDHVVLYAFTSFKSEQPFQPNFEIAEMKWVEINDLPGDVSDATQRRIDEYFGGTAVSEIW